MPRARPPRPAVPALVLMLVLVLALVVDLAAEPAGADPADLAEPPGAAADPGPASTGPAQSVTYRPPVVAEVRDPFRPPATRYGRGNRGLEYATTPGGQVRAAAPGVVAFAGQVAGRLHVTVAHPDGVRTTYGPLARIAPGLVRGARIRAGEVVGAAGELLLWTARIGGAYVDPAVLLDASGPVRVRLVPDRPRPAGRRKPLGPR